MHAKTKQYSLILVVATCSFCLNLESYSKSNYPIEKAIDGDTIAIRMDKLPSKLSHIKVRIYGVDTPEKSWRGQCEQERLLAEQASKFTKKKIAEAKKIEFVLRDWDKYGGRVLGDVILDGNSLREDLIKAGLAREYYGDKKRSWCEDTFAQP